MGSYYWEPKGSVPYDGALMEGELREWSDGVAFFSTQPYVGDRRPAPRDPKKCVGNGGTCEGFKSGGTDYCVGHRKALAKQAAITGGD